MENESLMQCEARRSHRRVNNTPHVINRTN